MNAVDEQSSAHPSFTNATAHNAATHDIYAGHNDKTLILGCFFGGLLFAFALVLLFLLYVKTVRFRERERYNEAIRRHRCDEKLQHSSSAPPLSSKAILLSGSDSIGLDQYKIPAGHPFTVRHGSVRSQRSGGEGICTPESVFASHPRLSPMWEDENGQYDGSKELVDQRMTPEYSVRETQSPLRHSISICTDRDLFYGPGMLPAVRSKSATAHARVTYSPVQRPLSAIEGSFPPLCTPTSQHDLESLSRAHSSLRRPDSACSEEWLQSAVFADHSAAGVRIEQLERAKTGPRRLHSERQRWQIKPVPEDRTSPRTNWGGLLPTKERMSQLVTPLGGRRSASCSSYRTSSTTPRSSLESTFRAATGFVHRRESVHARSRTLPSFTLHSFQQKATTVNVFDSVSHSSTFRRDFYPDTSNPSASVTDLKRHPEGHNELAGGPLCVEG